MLSFKAPTLIRLDTVSLNFFGGNELDLSYEISRLVSANDFGSLSLFQSGRCVSLLHSFSGAFSEQFQRSNLRHFQFPPGWPPTLLIISASPPPSLIINRYLIEISAPFPMLFNLI